MKKIIYFKRPGLLVRTVVFRSQVFLLKKLIRSVNAWKLFNQMGIEGFGVNLIRLYFPIYYDKRAKRTSFSVDVTERMSVVLRNCPDKDQFIMDVIEVLPEILKLPVNEADKTMPYLDNYYFGICDAAVMAVIMKRFKPSKIVEVGSGISTRYMKLFRDKFSLNTEITCIDPFPRAEIEGVADVIIREPLEAAIETTRFKLQRNDVIFLDGSHYIFQGNDTLTFFFKFLPSVPAGVIIHIHDIYLPYDYTEDVAPQLWSEQYIVAAMLLSGFSGFEILFPAYYFSQTDEPLAECLKQANAGLNLRDFKLRTNHSAGYSLWIRKT